MPKKYLLPGMIMLSLAAPALLAQETAAAQGTPPAAHPRRWWLPWQSHDAASSQPLPAAGPGQAAVLRDGDTVEIRIANVPLEDMQQFNQTTYTVDEGGMINLPYIGLIKAAGSPPSQVQIMIQNKLITAGIYTNPTVTVNLPTGTRYLSVGGAVRQPQRVPYTPDLTLMSTINAAGGASDFAGDKIRLIRGGKAQFFSRKLLAKDPTLDPRVEPGDQIEIIESLW